MHIIYRIYIKTDIQSDDLNENSWSKNKKTPRRKTFSKAEHIALFKIHVLWVEETTKHIKLLLHTQTALKILGSLRFFMGVSSAHQGCIYSIKNTEKN